MIVRKNLKTILVIRIAIRPIAIFASVGAIAWVLHDFVNLNDQLGIKDFSLPFPVVGTLGTALAIILAFRNNAAYDRWWEARKIWGGIVNSSRTFGRQVTNMINNQFTDQTISEDALKSVHQRLIYRHLAWINALRFQLRKQDKWNEIESFLDKQEYEWLMKRRNKATQLIQLQAEDIRKIREQHLTEDFRFTQLDNTLTEFYNLQGKAERIKNTPLPRQYDYFPKIFMALFIILLPFGLIKGLSELGLGWTVIPLTAAIGYVFYVIRKVGEFNENPFENRITDTPMTALCRTIEIDLREMLKEENVPPAIEPRDGFLF